MKRVDLLLLLGLILVLVVGIFSIAYYFNKLSNECVRSPFTFGANQLKERYDREVHGVIYILPDGPEIVPTIIFNSNNISIKK